MAPVVLTIAVGTFAALLAGWVVGLVMGLITRSLLPRGYKTLRSFAYELPLEMQPFREVLKMETDLALAEVNVAASCPLVDRSLRDLRLREAYKTNVLAIHCAGGTRRPRRKLSNREIWFSFRSQASAANLLRAGSGTI